MSSTSEELRIGSLVLERFEAGEIFVPIEGLTWIDIKGADRVKILNNITTNNIASLAAGSGCETFITDARGRTFGHGMLYALDDRLRFLTVAGQFERIAQQIDRYVVREDVSVEDASDRFNAVFFPGVVGSVLASRWKLTRRDAPMLNVQGIQIEELSATVYQVPWTSDGDWLIVVPVEESEHLESALVQSDLQPGHTTLLHCARIRNRFPWFGIDCDESNLPQEMDRDSMAISFKKGCYLGQETVARLDALGQVQKKLKLWKFDSQEVPQQTTELMAGDKVVATVTSSGYCFANEAPIALAMTRRSHFSPGSTAESNLGSAIVIEPN